MLHSYSEVCSQPDTVTVVRNPKVNEPACYVMCL